MAAVRNKMRENMMTICIIKHNLVSFCENVSYLDTESSVIIDICVALTDNLTSNYLFHLKHVLMGYHSDLKSHKRLQRSGAITGLTDTSVLMEITPVMCLHKESKLFRVPKNENIIHKLQCLWYLHPSIAFTHLSLQICGGGFYLVQRHPG